MLRLPFFFSKSKASYRASYRVCGVESFLNRESVQRPTAVARKIPSQGDAKRIALRLNQGVIDQARTAHARRDQHIAGPPEVHDGLERFRIHDLRVVERYTRFGFHHAADRRLEPQRIAFSGADL